LAIFLAISRERVTEGRISLEGKEKDWLAGAFLELPAELPGGISRGAVHHN